jgi:uncharacterized protein YciI
MRVINHARYIDDQDTIAKFRPLHREYLSGLLKEGRLAAAGPYEDGSGTLIIYNVASMDEARDIIANDPFTANNVFVTCDLRPWKIVFNQPELLKPA